MQDVPFDELSRELRLLVEHDGTIVWGDEAAGRLGVRAGDRLDAHAVTGTEAKVHLLLGNARGELQRGWELALVIDGRPATVLCNAMPHDGRIALVASHVPQDTADAVAEASRAMHEIVLLNRELARQKSGLEDSNQAIRSLHDELAGHADRLRASADLKGRLVASVSHEFRTPLHSILGLSRLLLGQCDGPLTDEQRTQVAFIRSSAEELAVMINDMLDLAQLDAGTAPDRIHRFELSELISAIRGTMRPLVPADGAVQLVFDPAPEIALETDQSKLAQIARNLIANALQFTARGEVRVTTLVDRDELQVAVHDSGIGIAPADHERIFDEFVQVDSPLQRERRGTGLGLPLAKRLAISLGGRIDLASTLSEGSTFTVAIPRVHPQVAQRERAAACRDALHQAGAPGPRNA